MAPRPVGGTVGQPARAQDRRSPGQNAAMEVHTGTVPRAVEPPESRWVFPGEPPARAGRARRRAGSGAGPAGPGPEGEVVGIGADLEPGTLLAAYRAGVFPMPARRGLVAWWAPDPRGVIPLQPGALRVTRSLRRSCARYEIRVDTAFDVVIDACAGLPRHGAWIDPDIVAAYRRLHRLGWAHSVEAWDSSGELAGGLYGVAVGGLFAGESMFHLQTDASKVALVGLVGLLRDAGSALLDVQWATAHLVSLGAVEISRVDYLRLLPEALSRPQPEVFGG